MIEQRFDRKSSSNNAAGAIRTASVSRASKFPRPSGELVKFLARRRLILSTDGLCFRMNLLSHACLLVMLKRLLARARL
jgi:hypothetical protein